MYILTDEIGRKFRVCEGYIYSRKDSDGNLCYTLEIDTGERDYGVTLEKIAATDTEYKNDGKITNVGELIDYLSKYNREEPVKLYAKCDGGCCYKEASVKVNDNIVLTQKSCAEEISVCEVTK